MLENELTIDFNKVKDILENSNFKTSKNQLLKEQKIKPF